MTETGAALVAAANHQRAVALKRSLPEHAECPGAPSFDPEFGGVTCFCGEYLGMAKGAQRDRDELPPSRVTLDSADAEPVHIEPIEQEVRTHSGLSSAVHPADPIVASVEVIDPNSIYTPADVEAHLLDATARLERGAHYERVCAEDYGDKALAYALAHTRARVAALKEVGGAESDRSAWAQMECEAEFIAMSIADMKLKAIKSTMHSLRSIQSTYQSVLRSVMATYNAAGQVNRERR